MRAYAIWTKEKKTDGQFWDSSSTKAEEKKSGYGKTPFILYSRLYIGFIDSTQGSFIYKYCVFNHGFFFLTTPGFCKGFHMLENLFQSIFQNLQWLSL